MEDGGLVFRIPVSKIDHIYFCLVNYGEFILVHLELALLLQQSCFCGESAHEKL